MNAEQLATPDQQGKGIPWLLLGAVIVVLAVLISLGNWQVRRLAWKEDLLARIDERIHSEAIPLAGVLALLDDGEDFEYMPVTAEGAFLPGIEQHVLSTWKGVSGWNVYAPMETPEGIVFVNRGFVPYDRKAPDSRPESLPEGPQALAGLARTAPAEKPGFLVPENAPGKNEYYWKDLSAMTAATGLANQDVLGFFVDAGPYDDPATLPVGGVTNIELPNNHLQYAITWYGLAAALVGVAGVFLWRRRR